MSRTGKLSIVVPAAVKVAVKEHIVSVEGPKGQLTKTFSTNVQITLAEGHLSVLPLDETTFAHAMQGTARSILASMVQGVQTHYVKDLEIQGTGFKAILKGNTIDLALGYSHPILYAIPAGITVTTTDGGTKIKVEGADKHMVGQVAADIKHYYPVEPYKGKGVRIVGQFVRRKEGKKTA